MKSLTMRYDTAQVRDLNDMREFLEQAVLVLGGSEDDAGDLVLAVNEAVTNVLLHGYNSQPGPVILCVEVANDDLRVILTDSAPPFDPTRVPPPDIFLPLEDRPLGGLGGAGLLGGPREAAGQVPAPDPVRAVQGLSLIHI